ncbi:MAG: YeeE/YedE family protein [Planctomycetes bacterium]|nr:YeeE/YedE family protein [Planctomycetota bacterium]
MDPMQNRNKPFMNPYLAGVFLGLTLLSAFLILGTGLGASAAIARVAAFCELCLAPAHALNTEYFGAWGDNPLSYYLVFMFLGVLVGGAISAGIAGRCAFKVERGAACSPGLRLTFALAGGVLVGFASRLASGCTSGQALTGTALLLTGSFVFLIAVFAGGYAAAFFVRRQWHD